MPSVPATFAAVQTKRRINGYGKEREFANDEGEAYEKARNFAEEADMSDFVLTEEKESRVLEHR